MKLSQKELKEISIDSNTHLNEMLYRLEKSKIKFLLVFKENKFIGYITPIMLKTEIQSFGLEYQTSSEKIT